MTKLLTVLGVSVLVFSFANGVRADTQLDVGPSIVLSDQMPDGDLSAKIKIVRLGNGTLVVAYGDAGTEEHVYDVKANTERPARDIFVRRCNSNSSDCSDLASWSAPINIAGTASRTSATALGRVLRKAACPSMEIRTNPMSSATAKP